MTEQRPGFAPAMVLAQVSLRVVVPLLAGVIAGLVADSMGHTAPQFVLLGMAAGTLVSILLLRAFIVSTAARMRRERDAAAESGTEEHEQATADRP
jgi:hypothetical protein